MTVSRHLKTSFTGGEFSPDLAARVDLDRYRTGAKTAKNVLIHPHGGVSNRAGFKFLSAVVQDSLTVQVPFVANVDNNEVYTLMFSDGVIHVTRNDFPVYEDALEFGLGYDAALPQVNDDTEDEDTEAGDLVAFALPATVNGSGGTNGTVESSSATVQASGGKAPYTYAWVKLSGGADFIVSSAASQNTAFSHTGTGQGTYSAVYVCDVTDSAAQPVTTRTNQVTVVIERNNVGGGGGGGSPGGDFFKTFTPPTATSKVTTPDVGVLDEDYAVFALEDHGWYTGDMAVVVSPDTPRNHNLDVVVFRLDDDRLHLRDARGNYILHTDMVGTEFTLRRRYSIDAPYTEDELREVHYAQDNDLMYLTHQNHPPHRLTRLGDTDWVFEPIDFTPNTNYPTIVNVVRTLSSDYTRTDDDNVVTQVGLPTTYKYVVSSVDEVTGEESLPSAVEASAVNDLNLHGAKNRIAWSPVAGVEAYVVYKNVDGVYGYIGRTSDLFFNDDNIAENTADGPQQGLNPFDGEGNYPRTVGMHDQRIVYASTVNDPQAVFLSKSAIQDNFDAASPAKADDAITFRIRAKERQDIRSILSTSAGLGLFTSTAEWLVTGGDQQSFLTPTNPRARPQTRRGSYYLPPLSVGDIYMYAQGRGGVIRDFTYSLGDDAYTGADRTIMSRHLFERKRIVSWCYAQSPYSMLWCVMDDGTLLSMTYLREHEVWAWARQDIGGFVESVVTIPEQYEDPVYVTVKREMPDGSTIRTQERMMLREALRPEEWFFVDSGLQYKGEPTSVVHGLQHLEGCAVSVLADEYVISGKVVVDGSVDLGREYSNIVVGLPYVSEIETLDLHLGNVPELGVIQGRETSIPNMTIRVEDTRGVEFGQHEDRMTRWDKRRTEKLGNPLDVFTGLLELDIAPNWTNTGNIMIRQVLPLPMTVLSVGPEVEVGG